MWNNPKGLSMKDAAKKLKNSAQRCIVKKSSEIIKYFSRSLVYISKGEQNRKAENLKCP
jgi:hypothetical protein